MRLKMLTIVVSCPKYDFDSGVLEISPTFCSQVLMEASLGVYCEGAEGGLLAVVVDLAMEVAWKRGLARCRNISKLL